MIILKDVKDMNVSKEFVELLQQLIDNLAAEISLESSGNYGENSNSAGEEEQFDYKLTGTRNILDSISSYIFDTRRIPGHLEYYTRLINQLRNIIRTHKDDNKDAEKYVDKVLKELDVVHYYNRQGTYLYIPGGPMGASAGAGGAAAGAGGAGGPYADLEEGKLYRMYISNIKNADIVLVRSVHPLQVARLIPGEMSSVDKSKQLIRVEEWPPVVTFIPLGEIDNKDKAVINRLETAFNPPDLGEFYSDDVHDMDSGKVYYIEYDDGHEHRGIRPFIYVSYSENFANFLNMNGYHVKMRSKNIVGIYLTKSGTPHVLSRAMKSFRHSIKHKGKVTYPREKRNIPLENVVKHIKKLKNIAQLNAFPRRRHILTLAPNLGAKTRSKPGNKVGGYRRTRRNSRI